MATPFSILYDGVTAKLRSTGLANISDDGWHEILADYIRPACVRFRACKQDLSKRNEAIASFDIALTDEEIEILVNFMYIEYLGANFINVPSLLRQSLISRDYHAFSSRNHLDGLIGLRTGAERQTRQMISAYSSTETDLFENLAALRQKGDTAGGGEVDDGDDSD